MNSPLVVGLIASALVLGPGSLAGTPVVLQAAKDNSLYGEDVVRPLMDRSNGLGEHLFSGLTGFETERRTLIAFDVAGAIPAGSIVTAVTLTLKLNLESFSQPATPVAVHRLLADWGEGTSDAPDPEGQGAPATPGSATWLYRQWATALWEAAGGDFVAAASGTAVVGNGLGFYSWTSAGMAADVQLWLDQPASNFGWILVGDEATPFTAKRYVSSNHPVIDDRPTLTVQFDPAPIGAGAIVVPLVIAKTPGQDLSLSWGESCVASDADFAVYEGTLGLPATLEPISCSTFGSTSTTIDPAGGNRFYLVVPHDGAIEGSYGTTSMGLERPPSALACWPQTLADCP